MKYQSRNIEKELRVKLLASGAVLIKGPKSCGKTDVAKQFAKSVLQVDRDERVAAVMTADPSRLLLGKTPRLIDGWQVQPKLWNYICCEVDDRKKKGQFILTGSANPEENANLHSGAGRFTIVNMHTMSWQEMGYSTGEISMAKLFLGEEQSTNDVGLGAEVIVERILKGGWPALLNTKVEEAMVINAGYVDLLAEVDMSRVSNVKRDPVKVKALLKAISRNIATVVDNATLEKDIKSKENDLFSRPTVIDYLDALERLMIFEEQPAFGTHIRSANSLRKSPKRHLCDVSLAVAALGLDKQALLNDLNYCGFLFESLAYHDLKIYAQANDANVFHYRDSTNLEVDAIVQKRNGDWMAFEVKLGTGQIEEAAKNLLHFNSIIDTTKAKLPKSLNIITGTGMSYTRQDGVNVISLASLGS